MPVTVRTAPHAARAWSARGRAQTEQGLFEGSCQSEVKKSKTLMRSSISQSALDEHVVFSSQNGFVYACIDAYSQHHNLILRPEDIWFAILSQLSFYVNANAEELRDLFVAHKGQKRLVVPALGDRHTVDFGRLAQQMTGLIQENVLDPDLRKWIMPEFSTTTETDKVVASILMMGTLQKYFSYGFSITCGIPFVTLLGEKKDWEDILQRIEKLVKFGAGAVRFAELLRPVLRRFSETFDSPTSSAIQDFWARIAHEENMGSGPTYLSGWITAFCFWDVDGRRLYGRTTPSRGALVLDGNVYHDIDISDIPAGFTSVPVDVNDNGDTFETKMVAGSVAVRATSSGEPIEDRPAWQTGRHVHGRWVPDGRAPTGAPDLDTIQPMSGWFMYELKQ